MRGPYLRGALWLAIVLMLTGCVPSSKPAALTVAPEMVPAPQTAHPQSPVHTAVPATLDQPNPPPTSPIVDGIPAPLKPGLVRPVTLGGIPTHSWHKGSIELSLPESDITLPRTLWLNDSTLAITQHTETAVVNMSTKQVTSVSDAQFAWNTYLGSRSVTPDGRRMAFIRNGQLVVRENDGEEMIWDLFYDSTNQEEWSVEVLSWSPNGRYLIGSFYYPAMGKVKPSKLWLVDIAQSKLTSLVDATIRGRAYGKVVWSPTSDQAVIWDSVNWYKTGNDHQWLSLDCSSGTLKVVVPQTSSPLDYAFEWDAAGNLTVIPELPGPDGTYAVITDPDNGDPWHANELRFVTPDGEVKHRIDLTPSITAAGVPAETPFCYLSSSWSPDGRYLLMAGHAYTGHEETSVGYALLGSMNSTNGEIIFMPTQSVSGYAPPYLILDNGWIDNSALVKRGGNDNGLALVDAASRSLAPIVEGEAIIAARSIGSSAIVVTTSAVTQFTLNGEKRVLALAPKDSKFTDQSSFSPTGQHLALVTGTRVEVMDLYAFGGSIIP